MESARALAMGIHERPVAESKDRWNAKGGGLGAHGCSQPTVHTLGTVRIHERRSASRLGIFGFGLRRRVPRARAKAKNEAGDGRPETTESFPNLGMLYRRVSFRERIRKLIRAGRSVVADLCTHTKR